MNKYGLNAMLTAKRSYGSALAGLLLEAGMVVQGLPGCRAYIVGTDPLNPDNIYINEVWDTKADHDNALNDPKVRELIKSAMPLLDGPPAKGLELEIYGGVGLQA